MKIPMTILCGVLLSMIVSAGLAHAQEEKASTIKFRTVYFESRDNELPIVYSGTLEKRTEVSLSKTRISDPQEAIVRDGNKVDFFVSADAEKPITTVTFQNSGQPLLFVFVPVRNRMHAWAVEVPKSKFGKGATMMINVTKDSIAIKHGSKKATVIASGKSRVLKVPVGFKQPMLPVQIFERKKTETGKKQWKIAQSTRWAVDERFRSYVFIYRKPGGRHLLMHGVPERLVAPPQPQP